MKILLSAFACAPSQGSEPEVGLRTVAAAARAHDVWLLVNHEHAEFLASVDLGPRVEVVPVPLVWGIAARTPGLAEQHLAYALWQRRARRVARDLHERIGFDLAHHVTLSSWWTDVGVAGLGIPLVAGPLSGAVNCPIGLFPVLGPRGAAEHAARWGVRALGGARPSVRRNLASASHLLANNQAVLAKVPSGPVAELFPHTISTDIAGTPTPGRSGDDIVFAGRLPSWKGGTLAVRALSHLRHPSARLVVCGDGADRGRMERLASARGVTDRLVFAGKLSRDELLARVAGAAALLHPSVQEEGGMAVAEGLALGTPVVVLDRGGPPATASMFPDSPSTVVRATTPEATARRLAGALDEILAAPAPAPGIRTPSVDYAGGLLAVYESCKRGGSRSSASTNRGLLRK